MAGVSSFMMYLCIWFLCSNKARAVMLVWSILCR